MQDPMQPPQPPKESGGPGELVATIQADLLKLQELLGASPAAEKVAILLDGLDAVLSEASGPKEKPAPVGPVDQMGGLKGVPRV